MNLFLYGIGTKVPQFSIEQTDAAQIVKGVCCESDEQARMLTVLYRRSGVAPGNKKARRTSSAASAAGLMFIPATSYSSTQLPVQYHRRWRA